MNNNKVTIVDRLITAFVLFGASFITGVIVWGILWNILMRFNLMTPFSLVLFFSLCFTVFGFLAPNKSIDAIGILWEKLHQIIKALIYGGGI